MIRRVDFRSFRIAALAAAISTVAALTILCAGESHAEDYPATKPVELEELAFGTDPIGFNVSAKEYNPETGQAYSQPIKSSGFQEYAVVAPEIFGFIWLRKIEAGGMEIKADAIYRLEFEDEGEAESFSVPIRPGTCQMYARGLKEKGTVVAINVRQRQREEMRQREMT